MANTYTSLRYHIIFSTKNRYPFIEPEIQERCYEYMNALAQSLGATMLAIGGIADHVHLLIGIPASISVSQLVKRIKGSSSNWIKKTFPKYLGFAWQDGYAAFTVNLSMADKVKDYILKQHLHHKTVGFTEELEKFLISHEIAFDKIILSAECVPEGQNDGSRGL